MQSTKQKMSDVIRLVGQTKHGALYVSDVLRANCMDNKGLVEPKGMKGAFSYQVGYKTLDMKKGSVDSDFRALLVIEPRNRSVVTAVPFEKLQAEGNPAYDVPESDYLPKMISAFEQSGGDFNLASKKGRKIESLFGNIVNAFDDTAVHCMGVNKYQLSMLHTNKGFDNMTTGEMTKLMQTAINEMLDVKGLSVDEISKSAPLAVPYMIDMGVLSLDSQKPSMEQKYVWFNNIRNTQIYDFGKASAVSLPMGFDDSKNGFAYVVVPNENISRSKQRVGSSNVRLLSGHEYDVSYLSQKTNDNVKLKMEASEIKQRVDDAIKYYHAQKSRNIDNRRIPEVSVEEQSESSVSFDIL